MANRHNFKRGGASPMKGRDDYSGGKENVAKEARSTANFKRGGKAGMKASGGKGMSRIKKARGGSCDQSPFSSAKQG